MATKPKRAKPTSTADEVVGIAKTLRDEVDALDFSEVIPWVYNPLQYAWAAHEQYIRLYARATCQVLFVGMNPGPWGMAQTGVPFGQIEAAHEWLGIDAPIHKAPRQHRLRPIEGWACKRSEVSGERLWGLFKARYTTPDSFFDKHFVCNYCPLVFMEESARNLTPDKLPAGCRVSLESICDRHLGELIKLLSPDWVIGVGAWAESCAKRVAPEGVRIGRILHPSPASPAANRDWAGTATSQLQELGVW
jgi:single-strand selective monofunctional uracil DNA glycosylase